MLSLDGTLRYLPFAALHDGEQYLAESYALAVYTRAADTSLKDRPRDESRFAGFGVTKKWPRYDKLEAVERELGSIPLDGRILYDEKFTAESFRTTLEQRPPVVHVASHFTFTPGSDANSSLLLGDGSELTLAEIRRRYRFVNVDLVALSACQTGMGGSEEPGERAAGEENGAEVEGFGVSVQKRGAKGVLATLWDVND